MDDAGFFPTLATRPFAGASGAARPARRRAAVGLVFALAVHLGLLAMLAVNLRKPDSYEAYEEPVLTMTLAARPAPPQPKPPADKPQPERISPPKVPPYIPHQTLTPAVSPMPPAPAPAPPPAVQAPAPAPESPPTPAAPVGASRASFESLVLARIERARRYPPAARARREEGVATVAFTLSRGGKASDIKVTQSAGSALLDREAIETVRRAQPLPPVPDEIGAPLRLVVNLEFFIR